MSVFISAKIRLKERAAMNIFDAVAPLSSMSKFCGYSMFTISRSDFSIASKRSDVCFQIWIVVINCLLCFLLLESDQDSQLHKSDIISKALPIIFACSYALYVFTIVASLGTREKQSILIKLICEIDDMVRVECKVKNFFHLWLAASRTRR